MSTLAAARADNFYYPKSWDPSKGSLNKFQNSHPLGKRAKKIDQGILVIRFEVPFHIRCLKCMEMIGKGVRFNAEKKQVGKYMSTRIWEFAMDCHLCGNKIVVRTDPENCEYKFIEGAHKIFKTEDATDAEFLRDEKEIEKIRTDKFYQLEHQQKDVIKGDEEKGRLGLILEKQDQWKDDYEINSLLRKKFRGEKKIIEKEIKEKKELKNFGLEISKTLNPEDMEAVKTARFHGLDHARKNRLKQREEIRSTGIFGKKNEMDAAVEKLKLKMGNLPQATRRLLKSQMKADSLNKMF